MESKENKVGRPTVITPETVVLLQSAFKDGANISQACILANISRDAYYDKIKNDQDFSDKMEAAQQDVSIQARKNLVDQIRAKNPVVSLTWLERKEKGEFAPRTELTGPEGTPLGYIYDSDIKKIEGSNIIELKEGNPQ